MLTEYSSSICLSAVRYLQSVLLTQQHESQELPGYQPPQNLGSRQSQVLWPNRRIFLIYFIMVVRESLLVIDCFVLNFFQ